MHRVAPVKEVGGRHTCASCCLCLMPFACVCFFGGGFAGMIAPQGVCGTPPQRAVGSREAFLLLALAILGWGGGDQERQKKATDSVMSLSELVSEVSMDDSDKQGQPATGPVPIDCICICHRVYFLYIQKFAHFCSVPSVGRGFACIAFVAYPSQGERVHMRGEGSELHRRLEMQVEQFALCAIQGETMFGRPFPKDGTMLPCRS